MSSFTTPLQYEETGEIYNGRKVYRITAPFTYVVGDINNPENLHITVPVGFETDLASVAWPLSKLFPPDGPWAKAAVVHDYLYNTLDFGITKAVADAIFYEAMQVLGVNKWVALAFFFAVFIAGKSRNDRNKQNS